MNLQLPVAIIKEAWFPEPVHEKLTRDRVVPTISARVSWLIFGITVPGTPSFPKLASNSRTRASRFSLEQKDDRPGPLRNEYSFPADTLRTNPKRCSRLFSIADSPIGEGFVMISGLGKDSLD
jgi:hypothetical protein